MDLNEKLKVIDALYFTDSSGVVSRLSTPARSQAEQLLTDNPRLSIPELLLRIPLEDPLPLPLS